MRDSVIIVLFFIAGLVLSYLNWIPQILLHPKMSTYVLYVLLFVVGFSVGSDKEALKVLYKASWKNYFSPFGCNNWFNRSCGFVCTFIKRHIS